MQQSPTKRKSSVPTFTSESVSSMRRRFLNDGEQISPQEIRRLETDARAGVRAIAQAIRRRHLEDLHECRRLQTMLQFESKLVAQGFRWIAGVDEAGMAPLAGPVCAGAAILPIGYTLRGLDDSKKISSDQRRSALATSIKRDAIAWAVGWTSVEEIDAINIYQSGLLAMQRAVSALTQTPDYVLVDARTIPDVTIPQDGIIRGDEQSLSIAAGAILAKTSRDALMSDLHAQYPGYGFDQHKGYPTPAHLSALRRLGASPVHRRTFGPVRSVLGT